MNMAQASLLQLAQAGDAEAIAALMNASLQAIGVSARAAWKDGNLHVLLESDRVLAQPPAIEFIRRGILRLGAAWISSAIVYGRVIGQTHPDWIGQIELTPEVANPFVLDADADLAVTEVEPSLRLPALSLAGIELPTWENVSLFHLVWLSMPILVFFSVGLIWSRYLSGAPSESTDRVSSVIPQINQRSSNLLGSTDAESDDPYAKALKQAETAVRIGKTAQIREDWRDAADAWQAAIDLLNTVPQSHPNYANVATKVDTYRANLRQLERDKLSGQGLQLVKTITGGISPKSIVYSGNDLFFAQNMMYNHTVTVYDRQFNLLKTIPDSVNLADYGYTQYPGPHQGSPVEVAFSPDSKDAWVSNYEMSGAGFTSGAGDDCSPSSSNDQSFLYRISTRDLGIKDVVQVGAVPKYVAVTPNNQYVLTSNWCSWDVSVVDPQQNKEIRRIQLGAYPRGIVVDPTATTAYVAVMGSYDVATINLTDFSVGWIRDVGHGPRHLNLSPDGKFLYVTLNGEGQVAKIDLATQAIVTKVATGDAPRSMAISDDGRFLYVVNYNSDTISKVRTEDMQVVQTVGVNSAPIGITYDPQTHQVWVACYSGSIQVFQD